MQASDRFNINSQLEHLQAKYVGTGHADLNRFEWAVNIQRDSYASYIGHYPMLAYFALAENESIGRERYNFMQGSIISMALHGNMPISLQWGTHMFARIRKCFCLVVCPQKEKMIETCSAQPVSAVAN
ncbi:SPLICING FACTOR 3B SUBUNIT 5 [Salix purpurea]|uniref:SPLICING FACTOR 3B SUBUNIT 5 n=1 Tax=Salix purpurea TaxID=77065 RepID=A0A9Q0TX48_SALPP|nr:SPLICING FACTOR 3B SUBUNIT 5 [Salix purpurea]